MHEFSIAQALAEQLQQIVEENNLSRVAALNIRIGRLQAVVPDALLFALEVVLKDTVAEGATVNIEEVPCRIRCASCGGEFEVDEWSLYCPECEDGRVEVIAGKELVFDSLEGE
jgi:hydrogenase nickel incorporation protein HypA/HybF